MNQIIIGGIVSGSGEGGEGGWHVGDVCVEVRCEVSYSGAGHGSGAVSCERAEPVWAGSGGFRAEG